MTRDEVLEALRKLDRKVMSDYELAHSEADELLLQLIDDAEIRAAFEAVGKWYA